MQISRCSAWSTPWRGTVEEKAPVLHPTSLQHQGCHLYHDHLYHDDIVEGRAGPVSDIGDPVKGQSVTAEPFHLKAPSR